MLMDTTPCGGFSGWSRPSPRTTSAEPIGRRRQTVHRRYRQDDEELLTSEPVDRVVRPERGLDRLDDLAEDLVPGGVTGLVVDRLEPIQVDRHEPVGEPGPVDVGPHRAEVLGQTTPVAGPGQRVGPRGELERMVDALELDHVRRRPTLERPDPLELGEAPDLRTLEQDVAGQACAERDEEDDHEVAPLLGRERAVQVEREEPDRDDRVGQQPPDVGPRPPRQDERDEPRDHQEIAGALDGQRRNGEPRRGGGDTHGERDHPGDRLRIASQAARQEPPADERDTDRQAAEGQRDRRVAALEPEQGQRDRTRPRPR